MNQIIKLVMIHKEKTTDESFQKIVENLKYIIKFHIKIFDNNDDKEDAMQELLIVLNEILYKFSIVWIVPKDFESYDLDQLLVKNNDLEEFITKNYDKLKFMSKDQLLYEYNLYVNEKQFIKYVNISFGRKCRSLKMAFEKVRENEIFKDIDDIDLIVNSQGIFCTHQTINNLPITEENKQFLLCFIENNRLLTQEEVAKKLNITQQAVSKKWTKIIKQLKNL